MSAGSGAAPAPAAPGAGAPRAKSSSGAGSDQGAPGRARSGQLRRGVAVRTRPRLPLPTVRLPEEERGPRANRTVAAILAATTAVLAKRGYPGTTVDEISRVAGVSRASFYTYFPSKRDALLALLDNAASAARAIVEAAEAIPPAWDDDDIEAFVASAMAVNEHLASVAHAFGQAAESDDELRQAGMLGQLQLCGRLGRALIARQATPGGDPTALGLAVMGLFDRAWTYQCLHGDAVPADLFRRELTQLIAGRLRAVVPAPAPSGRAR